MFFELDHYDKFEIAYDYATESKYVWRINLLGGGRLHSLAERFGEMRSLCEYIKGEKKWIYLEGFFFGGKKRIQANFLTGLPYLPSKKWVKNGIKDEYVSIVKDSFFERPRNPDLYTAPLIVIKKVDKLLIDFIEKGNLAFDKGIVGIHSPDGESEQLKELYLKIKSNIETYTFLILLRGSHGLISRNSIVTKNDVDQLPYPENLSELKLSFWEKVLMDDVVEFMSNYVRGQQHSDLLFNKASNDDLGTYSRLFLKMLGSVFDELKAGKYYSIDGFICQTFYFGDEPEFDWVNNIDEKALRKIMYDDNIEARLRNVRMFRYYRKNVMVIIKPDRLRYWIKSVAIRDSDETFYDLYKMGY